MSRAGLATRRRSLAWVDTDLASLGPGQLVALALAGDRDAWAQIIHRYERVAWKVLSGFDLSQEDRNDVFASAFFRLFERLGTIREPEKLPGWIATTTRNEALTLLRTRSREVPVASFADSFDPADDRSGSGAGAGPDAHMIDLELKAALRVAFDELPADCRELLVLFMVDPPLSYDEIAQISGRPRGSLGPSRRRCLERLRRNPALDIYREGRP